MPETAREYDIVIGTCSDIFTKKMHDYGMAWRILRPTSITDQIFIKANRIRSIEEKGVCKINEGVVPEFIGIVNYSIMGLIQLELGPGEDIPTDQQRISQLYENYFQKAKALMLDKNHDYGEAWRSMRTSSYTDLILMKINRTKQHLNFGRHRRKLLRYDQLCRIRFDPADCRKCQSIINTTI